MAAICSIFLLCLACTQLDCFFSVDLNGMGRCTATYNDSVLDGKMIIGWAEPGADETICNYVDSLIRPTPTSLTSTTSLSTSTTTSSSTTETTKSPIPLAPPMTTTSAPSPAPEQNTDMTWSRIEIGLGIISGAGFFGIIFELRFGTCRIRVQFLWLWNLLRARRFGYFIHDDDEAGSLAPGYFDVNLEEQAPSSAVSSLARNNLVPALARYPTPLTVRVSPRASKGIPPVQFSL